MSAILSTDDLNDFITPGVACIKPVETLPAQQPTNPANPYEVTTEDAVSQSQSKATASISLTDCLACSGCVTSAEAVLVSLQSHQEVLRTLDEFKSIDDAAELHALASDPAGESKKVFVASISPQVRASLAAMYGISERKAGYMIQQLLSGPVGLRQGGHEKSGFLWVLDIDAVREMCLAAGIAEVRENAGSDAVKRPVLASSCPGWICYAEKTHPHILPHLSRLKSPQAMAGTLIKSVLSKKLGILPSRIWHLAVMPCFDKKLEASRQELTDVYWNGQESNSEKGIRDVDCVITAREILMLAESRGVSFPLLPQRPVPQVSFPDTTIDQYIFPRARRRTTNHLQEAGSSGGYSYHVLRSLQSTHPGSTLHIERGRNADVIEYHLVRDGRVIVKTARYYGFRNIQNLVRKLKPAKASRLPGSRPAPRASSGASHPVGSFQDYAYVEVMACPGGCTNGGGQIKASDLPAADAEGERRVGPAEQKEWLARVDEAYFSAESSGSEDDELDINTPRPGNTHGHAPDQAEEAEGSTVESIFTHWSHITDIDISKLIYTSYRQVESDVGKEMKKTDTERVATLASTLGGGW